MDDELIMFPTGGSIHLVLGAEDLLRIDADGTILVRGKPTEDTAEIVAALREFARAQMERFNGL